MLPRKQAEIGKFHLSRKLSENNAHASVLLQEVVNTVHSGAYPRGASSSQHRSASLPAYIRKVITVRQTHLQQTH